MSHTLAQMLFGLSFALVWTFIGGMIVGDSLHNTRRNRLDGAHESRLARPRS